MLLSSFYRYPSFICAFICAVGSCTSTIALQQATLSTSLPTSTSLSSTASKDVSTTTPTASGQSSPLALTTLFTSTTTPSSTLTSRSIPAVTPSAKPTQSVRIGSLSKGAEVGIIVAVTIFCVSAVVAAVVVHSMKPPSTTQDTHNIEPSPSALPAGIRDYSLSSTERHREQGDDRHIAGERWQALSWAAHSPYWF